MAPLTRGERLQIMLSPEELALVDDFRFEHRMPSRAAAVRELLQIGLVAAGGAAHGTGVKSANFGLFGRGVHSHDGKSEKSGEE
ncbi:hypothetical protein [Pseudorhodoplanes sinuspersici]|uniref:Uncharacterized protein n=1 Tax=Pseudorhodoplanes sinuspersici TaxID=1235591 RepID=A0A1W6ZSH5_9HYPH|nr:hypothetical protein [Pseudorhodoplanes sinuspersici]ARQ00324.1 hypothetical protein CAK95_15505 [Pseudorhodoplanes sinuspersici]RKE67516.1 hypothetical protein DFP91_5281 [Pseudorhodoplanes sinuspersici]